MDTELKSTCVQKPADLHAILANHHSTENRSFTGGSGLGFTAAAAGGNDKDCGRLFAKAGGRAFLLADMAGGIGGVSHAFRAVDEPGSESRRTSTRRRRGALGAAFVLAVCGLSVAAPAVSAVSLRVVVSAGRSAVVDGPQFLGPLRIAHRGLLFATAWSRQTGQSAKIRWSLAVSAVLLFISPPIFTYALGRAWNQEPSVLCALLALLAMNAARESPRRLWYFFVGGLALGLGIGLRSTLAPLIAPLGWSALAQRDRWRSAGAFSAGLLLALLPLGPATAGTLTVLWRGTRTQRLLTGLGVLQMLPLIWTNLSNPTVRVPWGVFFPMELYLTVFLVQKYVHRPRSRWDAVQSHDESIQSGGDSVHSRIG